ncbi:MAG: hypothetical protein U9N30_05595 [Campylobacterota bacterium]|nr:hypothetical protein [Campylobacterota bacterium]
MPENVVLELDQWELALEAELKKLQQCQINLGFSGCEPCPKLLDCELRNTYVKAVYTSMSKGSGGGFEF